MGLGTSIATVIILLGVVGMLVIIYPAIESGILASSNAFREQHASFVREQGTSLVIGNASVVGTCPDYNLTVQVNNTGSVGQKVDKLTFFDNNEVIKIENVTNSFLSPGKDINIVFYDMSSSAENHSIYVVADNGVTAHGSYGCG